MNNRGFSLAFLKQAQIYDKVVALPNGIYTTLTRSLDTNGAEFSGGEIQKLYIARALYHHHYDLYIFDEPTSALNNKSEKEVNEVFKNISRNGISLFITHKLNTTDFCNSIIVLNEGKIVESGSKEELLKNHSYFYEMIQASKQNEEFI